MKATFFVASVLSAVLTYYYLENHVEEDVWTFSDLPDQVQEWRGKGEIFDIHGYRMFVIDTGNRNASTSIVFLHGYPASSFDYHRALGFLSDRLSDYRLIFFDHVGFGFSDKPKQDFEYTLHDHAENALELIQKLDLGPTHFVAHDMGDSVLTEMLTRRNFGLLPPDLAKNFMSVTFTNGGMRYELINKRIGQILLTTPKVGPLLSWLGTKIPSWIAGRGFHRQLNSIYGPDVPQADREQDVEAMFSLTHLNQGASISHKTVSYLNDRFVFQPSFTCLKFSILEM